MLVAGDGLRSIKSRHAANRRRATGLPKGASGVLADSRRGHLFAADLVLRALLDARSEAETATAGRRIGDDDETIQVRVGSDGRLLEGLLQRWGNPDAQPLARYPFGIAFEAERTFDRVTIPSAIRAGWWWGTGRQEAGTFFRTEITNARFLR